MPDSEANGGERTKVLDFGIAKLSSQSLARTSKNAFLGTPTYAAPEQCYGAADVTDRADVYSLGVMLYEMLSGAPPFMADSTGDLMAAHMFTPPPPLKSRSRDLDVSICQLVDETLVKEPQQRPTMAVLEQRLRTLKELLGESSMSGVVAPLQPAPKGGSNLATVLSTPDKRSEDPTQVVDEKSLRAFVSPQVQSLHEARTTPIEKRRTPAWIVVLSCLVVGIVLSALLLALW